MAFTGMIRKKNKKNEGRGKGGHFACSESYDWNLYKKHTKEQVNSQGREQINALVERCAASLRLMSYQHFMIFMKGEYLSFASPGTLEFTFSIDFSTHLIYFNPKLYFIINLYPDALNLNILLVFFTFTNLNNRRNKNKR